MNIPQILQKKSKLFYLYVLVLGLLNAVMGVGILVVIRSIISAQPLPYFPEYDWQVFVTIVVMSFFVGRGFQVYMVRITNDLLFDLEVGMLQSVKSATYQAFEKIGLQNIYTAISDVRVLSGIPQIFITLFTSVVTIICGLGFLFWTSPMGGVVVTALMTILFLYYMFRNKEIEKDMNKLRDLQNFYYKYLADLLRGFKEVFMSRKRKDNLYNNFLRKNRLDARNYANSIAIKYINNSLVGSYSWYVVLGVVLFILPAYLKLDVYQTTMFLVAILYLIGPITSVSSIIPAFTQMKICWQRLHSFISQLGAVPTVYQSPQATTSDFAEGFQSLRLENIEFEYVEKGKSFVLSDINMEFEKGEIVFLTGGNGSGKSTLVNLITGLYKPKSGSIYFNETLVTESNYAEYRDRIAAIFTNNVLMGENYDEFNLTSLNKKLTYLIEAMKLTEVVPVSDENTLNHNLSKGQQKRLALIYSLLEEKDVLVLDEWAAEQDPEFRKYFYTNFLGELGRTGKTVIAVTHDDDYYPMADRVIKFSFGKIASIERHERTIHTQAI